MRMNRIALPLTVLVALVASSALSTTSAHADVPTRIHVQGSLLSSGGAPAADGIYDATFAIYNVPKGGSAAWTEGPVKVTVFGGTFSFSLGVNKPIKPGLLQALSTPWFGVSVGNEPEMPRVRMHSTPYAVLAASASGVTCKGCISAENGGFAWAGSKTKGGPATSANDLQCTGCVSVSELKIDGDLDLGGNALKANKVAAQSIAAGTVTAQKYLGDGSQLTGIKIPSGSCKVKGHSVIGINPDGTLKCAAALDPSALPGDGLDEISNDLLHNQFVDQMCGKANLPIPDNNPIGVPDTLIFPDIGLAQQLDVDIDLTNSDVPSMTIKLWDPNNVEYLLAAKNLKGKSLKTSFPSKTKPVKGDLGTWVGKNPKGKWRIQVIDGSFKNNGNDGAVKSWCVTIKTLSNKKVQLKGKLMVDGSVKLGADSTSCGAGNQGTLRYHKNAGLQVCGRNYNKSASKNGWAWTAALAMPVAWSGGCKQVKKSSGWHSYCLNGIDYNTAAGYLSVNSNGVVTVQISGFYRIDYYAIQHGCGQQDLQLLVNGKGKTYTHNINPSSSKQWNHTTLQYTGQFKAGDTFYIRAYHDGCGNQYTWHEWNASGAHSRATFRYVGPLKN